VSVLRPERSQRSGRLKNIMQNTKNHRGSLGWIFQAITGVLLIVLAGLHMIAQHFVAKEGLRNFEEARSYLANPVILPLEVGFLVVVTVHALLGVRAVLFDLGLSDATEKRITQAFWVIGSLTIAYGLWMTYKVITF